MKLRCADRLADWQAATVADRGNAPASARRGQHRGHCVLLTLSAYITRKGAWSCMPLVSNETRGVGSVQHETLPPPASPHPFSVRPLPVARPPPPHTHTAVHTGTLAQGGRARFNLLRGRLGSVAARLPGGSARVRVVLRTCGTTVCTSLGVCCVYLPNVSCGKIVQRWWKKRG